MKKHLLFIIVVLALLLPGSALATIVYSDFSCSGCDSTGAGTYGDPYQTIEKADDGLTGGDEVRVAKTGAHVALTGDLTFVNGSASVSTASDLTGELSAEDYIGKDTANEGWWEVASLTSDTITLTREYWGTAGDFSAYKMTCISWTEDQDIGVSGTSSSSKLKITGGWDLSTQTRTGYTYLEGDGSTTSHIATGVRSYLEIAYFGVGDLWYGIYMGGGSYVDIHDIQFFECSYWSFFSSGSSWLTFSDSILAGSDGGGVNLFGDHNFGVFESLLFLSVGTGNGDNDITISGNTAFCFFKSCSFYNAYDEAIHISGSSLVFEDTVIDTVTHVAVLINAANSRDIFFSNTCVSNTMSDAFNSTGNTGNRIHNTTYSSIGALTFACSVSSDRYAPAFYVTKDEGVAGNDFMVQSYGRIYRDTTDARSGACMKFDPSDAAKSVVSKVGTYKVTSVASDLTLSVYLKDDATFNGTVTLWAITTSQMAEPYTLKTPTTSYVQNSIIVASGDLVDEEYIHLWVAVTGTAGNVFIDDFSVSQ